jgi:hypothetical protein
MFGDIFKEEQLEFIEIVFVIPTINKNPTISLMYTFDNIYYCEVSVD